MNKFAHQNLIAEIPSHIPVPVPVPVLFIFIFIATNSIAESPYAPQPEASLQHSIDITWSRGPDLPQGFQDSNGGVIGNMVVTSCGFCAGHDNDKKPGKYPRGFLKKTWALDLDHESQGWQPLPDFPGPARQGLVAAPVGDALYFWGGFSYSAPFCYKDGYRLTRKDNEWHWDPLPDMPWPLCGTNAVVIDKKIYVFGGADYDENAFFTATDRAKNNQRLGARLLIFDTDNPTAGWTQLSECPGTPRWVGAVATLGGKIYVIGGATGSPYSTVVDNWVFDPIAKTWTRLRDLPVASGNFPAGAITFKDRYLLLGGGYQYKQIANPDGTNRTPYGTPHKFNDKGDYYNDIFTYDTQTNRFARATSMPLNNNLSMTLIHNDTVYMLGGETGGGIVEGVFYGHHPELCLKGKLTFAR